MLPARLHFYDSEGLSGRDDYYTYVREGDNPPGWALACRYSLRNNSLVPDYQGLVEVGEPAIIEALFALPPEWQKMSFVVQYAQSELVPVTQLPSAGKVK